MKLYYDLHIHSCLSPCGEDEMTPNNIVNMSVLKGLDVIAVTDHNHYGNIAPICDLAEQMGLICIPGVEVQTREEVHVLCYFKTVKALEQFFKVLETYRVPIKNKSDYFGTQQFADREDNIIGEYELALIMSMDIALEALEELVRTHDGLMIPAHVNKTSHSIMANLGFLPPSLKSKTVEIFLGEEEMPICLEGYLKLYNSDAHTLKDISEACHVLQVKEKTIDAVFEKLRGEV